MVLTPEQRFGRYRLQQSLGAGGMAEVFRAYDVTLEREVALKVLRSRAPAEGAERASTGSDVVREARLAASLVHPNVVTIFDVGEAAADGGGAVAYIAMELVDGAPLRAYVGDPAVPMARRIAWLVDVASALAAAHARGLVHRDIKPSNVMISRAGIPKVLDFGIAKRVPLDDDGASSSDRPLVSTLSVPGRVVGTLAYMAPEQLRAEPVDGRADQFAWGVTAYELLVGEKPWRRTDDALAVVSDVLTLTPPAPASRNPDVPRAVSDVVVRALEKEPAARHASMAALLAALTAASQHDEAARAPAHRGRAARGVAGVTAVAAAGVIAALALRSARAPTAPSAAASGAAAARVARECATARDCAAARGGGAWRCHGDDGVCAPLASEDCAVRADDAALERDDTVWVGTMFPRKGDDGRLYGLLEEDAVELARRDFAGTLGAARAARPFGVIACDDSEAPRRAAHHLAEVARVPAVIGFHTGAEIVDVAPSYFLPRGVLTIASLNAGAAVTQIPQPTPSPRLIWRTTYNMTSTAQPLARFVEEVLEPAIRAGGPGAPREAETRVAVVYPRNASGRSFADAAFGVLRFNGRGALENGALYQGIVYDDDTPAGYAAALSALRELAPSVVLYIGADAFVQHLVEPLEAGWPALRRRAFYVAMSILPPRAFRFIGADAARRRRFFGVTPVSNIPANAKFVMHYNQTFGASITRTFAPNASYDAFYLVAYAALAAGDGPVTGVKLARAIERLLPPGPPIEVGPSGIFEAFNLLSRGGSIDLDGAIGRLDFDVETGEAAADMAILCVDVGAAGGAAQTVESGLVYDAAGRRLRGRMRCP